MQARVLCVGVAILCLSFGSSASGVEPSERTVRDHSEATRAVSSSGPRKRNPRKPTAEQTQRLAELGLALKDSREGGYRVEVVGEITDHAAANALLKEIGSIQQFSAIGSVSEAQAAVDSLELLAGIKTLTGVLCMENRLDDLGPLKGLKRIEMLNVASTRVTNLEPLSGMKRLENLTITDTPVSDIGPLAGLRRLRSLRMADTNVSDLRPLSGLRRLKMLWATRSKVTDVSPLSKLRTLRTLVIDEGVDTSPLQRLRRLEIIQAQPGRGVLVEADKG